MRVATLHYVDGRWSEPFPPLDSPNTMVLVFAATSYRDAPTPFAELVDAYPNSIVLGCSTAGEIDQTDIRDESIVVAIARFDTTRLRQARASLSATDSFAAGEHIARSLQEDGLKGVVVLSEGVHVNGSELVRGLNAQLAEHVVVAGGLAADGDRFGRTWVLVDGATESNTVVAVGLYGDHVHVGHGSKGGWDPFGPERLVTRSTTNVLYELDGQPALALYKEYLGDRAADLPSAALLFPLSLRASSTDPQSVVRTVLAIDEAEQSMTFAGDIVEGHQARLMRANFDRLILGAEGAAKAAKGAASEHDGPTLAIAVSCVGRRLVLRERSEEETEVALDALPPGTYQVGFYSYGEISPHETGRCDLHNQTMTLMVVSESA